MRLVIVLRVNKQIFSRERCPLARFNIEQYRAIDLIPSIFTLLWSRYFQKIITLTPHISKSKNIFHVNQFCTVNPETLAK
jgi:hypothetical protein